MSTAPRFDLDVDAFWRDPYPALASMRAEAPIAFVPQLGATLLTRRDDIASMEKRVDVLSSDQPGGLMNRLMGQNMMRKDGAAHTAERNVYSPAIAPAAVAAHWQAQFQRHADHILDGLAGQGRGDLIDAFALPLSAECLKSMTGLTNVRYQDMDAWSQAMIQGIANYDGDPEVERRCNEATAAIDAAIDDVLPVVRGAPDHSLLSVMLEGGLSEAQARANVKLTISGGQNEPRKAIAGTIWALLTHPGALEEHRARRSDVDASVRRAHAMDLADRHVSSSRREAMDGRGRRPRGRRPGVPHVRIGEPRRDPFRGGREVRHHAQQRARAIVFGAGPHFCAGAAAARSMVADVALPTAFSRLRGLRLDSSAEVRIGGWAFRGLLTLPVEWDG